MKNENSKIKICCSEIEANIGDYIKLENGEVNVVFYDGEWNEYDDLFSIKYCPFCGKKIELMEE